MEEARTLYEGLAFGEGPRWHEGRLWLSDMHAHEVLALDSDGKSEVIAAVPTQPSGLGWLPDGRLLIVSMTDRRLLRLDAGGLTAVGDLSGIATFHCNDMVVDGVGRAYVGNFGFDMNSGEKFRTAALALVSPSGQVRTAADELAFPNGTVITPDGRTLIVAETFAGRLTAFDVAPSGDLSGRRVWAAVDGMNPDGICLDAEGAVWVASPTSSDVLRVHEGGRVSERIRTEQSPYACMLGGEGCRTLFILTASTHEPEECAARRDGRVLTVDVPVGGAGLP